jgi:hypothetical protein
VGPASVADEAKYLDGREIKTPPKYFLGAAASPFASNMKFQALREQKKVNAGAQFFQTNVVFDADALDEWLNEIAKRDILDKVYILIGITPLKNYKTAAYMDKKIPGVFVPEKILKRMETAKEKGGEQEEGLQIALELVEKIKTKQGVSGIHLMAVGWEEIVPRIVVEAGLGEKLVCRQPKHRYFFYDVVDRLIHFITNDLTHFNGFRLNPKQGDFAIQFQGQIPRQHGQRQAVRGWR